MLGKLTLETIELMVTIGMKEVLRSLEQDGAELITLQQKNKFLKGYWGKKKFPLDPANIEETLKVVVERRDRGAV